MEEVEKIIFEARAHEEGWAALENAVISNPNLTPVGRSHNGLEETLFRHVQDKRKVQFVCETFEKLIRFPIL